MEEGAKKILELAKNENIAIIVIGDPLRYLFSDLIFLFEKLKSATTHISLLSEAKKQNIPSKVLHNASIMNSVTCTGLPVILFIFFKNFYFYLIILIKAIKSILFMF